MNTTAVVLTGVGVLLSLWIAVHVWFRHRRRVIAIRLTSDVAGETVVRSPEQGRYRGATVDGYPTVTNDGSIALTRQRLVFRSLTGKFIEIPVADITGVREAATFRGIAASGRRHLVIRTAAGEIAFVVDDHAGWLTSLKMVGAEQIPPGELADAALRADVLAGVQRRRRARPVIAVVFTSIGLAAASVAAIGALHVGQSVSGDAWVVPVLFGGLAVPFLSLGTACGVLALRAGRRTRR